MKDWFREQDLNLHQLSQSQPSYQIRRSRNGPTDGTRTHLFRIDNPAVRLFTFDGMNFWQAAEVLRPAAGLWRPC